MTIRTMAIVAGLAALAAGCTVTPRPYDDRGYPHDHRIYRESDSYEGYYYVRIIYINGDPWYVDEYRRARPIPRHLHSHFQYSSWTRSLPPRFSRDREVRDGYDLSRIVYIDDVPHYVDDDRSARPVPTRLRSRLAYPVVVPHEDARRNGGERPRSPQPDYDREARPVPPAYGREQERQAPPAYGREREREMPPAYGAETMPRREEAQERVREESDRRAPPFVRDGRGAPAGHVMDQPPERGAGRDEGRSMPQDNGRNGDDKQRGARSPSPAGIEKARGKSEAVTMPAQPAGDGGQNRAGVANGGEQRSDAAAEKKNGKSKDRARDRGKEEQGDEEAGDGNAKGTRKYRGE